MIIALWLISIAPSFALRNNFRFCSSINKVEFMNVISAQSGNAEVETVANEVFGKEFDNNLSALTESQSESDQLYWKGRIYSKRLTTEEDKVRNKKSFDNLRFTFVLDSLFVSFIGLALVWLFGTVKDVKSFALGSTLGLGYAVLLGKYVESIGSGSQRGLASGGLRFLPVFLIVLLYGKNKEELSIIPELLGFSTYQLASLLQIFNKSAYSVQED